MSRKKLAVVSNIFPPYPSGQSMTLSKLLSPLDPTLYELICTRDYQHYPESTAFPPLPAPFHTLQPIDEDAVENMGIMRLLRKVDPDRRLLSRRLLRPFWVQYGKSREWLRSALFKRFRARLWGREIERVVRATNCEAIIVCTGDVWDLPAAYYASRFCNIPLLIWVFDDYKTHFAGHERELAEQFEPMVARGAQAILVVNRAFGRELKQRYGIESTVIHNAASIADNEVLDQQPHVFDQSEVNIVYAGAVYHAHYDAFHNMIQALDILNRADVKLHIYSGQSPEELAEQGIESPYIVHHGHIPQEQIPRVLRDADLLFFPLAFHSEITELLVNTLPTKTGGYLASGRTVLVHAPANFLIAEYFSEHDCGLVVDELDPHVLASAINDIMADDARREHYGRNARALADAEFELSSLRAMFDAFLDKNLSR